MPTEISLFQWVIPVILVACVAAYFVFEYPRREAFRALARRYGFTYRSSSASLPRQFNFLNALCQGDVRRAFNILEGTYEGRRMNGTFWKR